MDAEHKISGDKTGARGQTWTGTVLKKLQDFKSCVSTDSTTRALLIFKKF